MKIQIKKGDTVKVIAGSSRGRSGRVLSVDAEKYRARVEGVNMMKKHNKPSAQNPDGGIVELEGSIHISNLMLVDAAGTATRVSRSKNDKGNSVRISKKSGEEIK
ncbi:MAG: 50S ribosomal protein L24 [Salibacteraceae bacterium]